MKRFRIQSILLICGLVLPMMAQALINPNYTVVDLVRDNGQVLVLRVSAPKDGQIKAEVVEALVGEMPAGKNVVFDYSAAEDLPEENITRAFGGAATALGVMCVQKNRKDGVRVGALEIGITWMGLAQEDGKTIWKLDKDPNDLETVWGGSARQLIPAVRYALDDSGAAFPVVAAMKWGKDLQLGKLTGAARGCLVTTYGVIVLSDGGDRVYQPGAKGELPVDVTEKVGLTTKSRAMAAGDFNGDGRVDLASWDGTAVRLATGGADGRLTLANSGYEIASCVSLGTLGKQLVIGTTGGKPTHLLDAGRPVMAAHPLTTGVDAATTGPGGVCAVADFNGDGAADILQAFAHGIVLFAGQKEGGFTTRAFTKVEAIPQPTGIVCGDFDGDGRLDAMVTGVGGSALLSRDGNGGWINSTAETGEFGAANGPGHSDSVVMASCLSDLNGDGRPCVATFHTGGSPGLFFNRGFGCFGVARTLSFAEPEAPLPAIEALGGGQAAGIVTDMNGDLVPDLLAVDREHKVWVLFGEAKDPRRFHLTVSLTDATRGPLTVTVSMGPRTLGMYVVRPGEPVSIGLPKAGKVTLAWKMADGTTGSRDVAVMGPKQVEL